MNWLDFLLAFILVSSFIHGVVRGFARAIVGLISALAGLLLALWFYGVAGSIFAEYVSHKSIANFLGFATVFFLTVLAGALIGRLLAKIFKWVGLGWLDRLLGAALGALRDTLFSIGIVLILCAFSRNPPPRSVVSSRIAPYILGASSLFSSIAPRELKDGFDESYEKVKKIWSEITSSSSSTSTER